MEEVRPPLYFISYAGEIGKKWKDKIIEGLSDIISCIAVDEAHSRIPSYIRDKITGCDRRKKREPSCEGFIGIFSHYSSNMPVLQIWPIFELGIAYGGKKIDNHFFIFLVDEKVNFVSKTAYDTQEERLIKILNDIQSPCKFFDDKKIDDDEYVREILRGLKKIVAEREKLR